MHQLRFLLPSSEKVICFITLCALIRETVATVQNDTHLEWDNYSDDHHTNYRLSTLHRSRRQVKFRDNDPQSVCSSSQGTQVKCMPFAKCRKLTGQQTIGPICEWTNRRRPRVCCHIEQQISHAVTTSVPSAAVTARFCGQRSSHASNRRFLRQVKSLGSQFSPLGNLQNEPQVVGGRDAVEASWPWMAGIYRNSSGIETFLCGSTIISERYLVTAAHCFAGFRNRDASSFVVRVGAILLSNGLSYEVSAIITHPQYSSRQHYDDIAVVKLRYSLVFSDRVSPICLPVNANQDLTGDTVTLVGWGDQQFGGTRSRILQEVEIPVVNTAECNLTYSSLRDPAISRGITKEDFLCAGQEGKDACQSDSGGPLMHNEGGVWTLVGVVSFGYKCAVPGFSGVYTRVAKHLQWLEEVTK